MQVKAMRGDKIRIRNKAKGKLFMERPIRVQPAPRESLEEDSDDDEWFDSPASKQQEVEDHLENEEETGGRGGTGGRTRNRTAKSAQPSPREWKRKRVQAMKRDRQEKKAGDWDIEKTEGGWRRARDEEAKMLDNLFEPGEGYD